MSYLNMNRSHVYPTNLRQLPWNDAIAAVASKVEALRGDLVIACEKPFPYRSRDVCRVGCTAAASLPRCGQGWRERHRRQGRMVRKPHKGTDKIELSPACKAMVEDDCWHIGISDCLLDWVKIPDEAAALGLATALAARAEQKMVDSSILIDMPIPPDAATRAKFDAIVKEYREADHAKIDAVADKIRPDWSGPWLGYRRYRFDP